MTGAAKPNGKVAVIVQHTAHPLHKLWKKLGWPGFINQPPVVPWFPKILKGALEGAGLKDVKISGIEPWKVLFAENGVEVSLVGPTPAVKESEGLLS